ncbi:NAD(P)-dependent alcohol dehydrogenase [Saccharothrix syringae]|uniref:NAD(P)-dependent alcohol dehydrogenase n=1 Tax=Saccharothrix syringae TaxID=103733 RepID=A0A5Q0H0W4_SACSY|nr:NAD(P)-dependent alcohol dehydrogenase [Saccharothrix syringae]QFZ19829.1 NAD(P)-dependent alcohol dehydrogenase [Saccharothrix syringae]
MKAVTHTSYGPPDVLEYTDVADPEVGPDDVLVRVRAASLNFGDRAALRGTPRLVRLAFGLRRPRATILGRAVAGVVEAVGPRATRFRAGDRVVGEVDQRGFAEFVAAPQTRLARIPDGVSFEQAATLPIAGTTAHRALRLGGVQAGHAVLVNGASGGVGTFAVRLAALLGAEVTAVCGARNAEQARSLGAAHVVERDRQADIPGRYDVVVDLAGDRPLSAMRELLTPTGVYVASSGSGGPVLGPIPRLLAVVALSPFTGRRLRPLMAKPDVDDLAHLADLVASGELVPVVERTHPLAETADAIRRVEAEHARGKVVLVVPG